MFDIGWSELLLLGVVALIVVGPKDLPGMLRTLGQYTAKARGMARDFQRSVEDAAREADIGDVKELRDAAKGLRDFKNMRINDLDKPARSSASASRARQASASKPAPENPAPEKSAPEPAATSPAPADPPAAPES